MERELYLIFQEEEGPFFLARLLLYDRRVLQCQAPNIAYLCGPGRLTTSRREIVGRSTVPTIISCYVGKEREI